MTVSRPERLIGMLFVLGLAAVLVVIVAVATRPNLPGSPGGLDGRPQPAVDAVRADVLHVSDGDTIVVTIDGRTERVRYIGIDAPEVAHPDEGTAAECWGDEASAANAALVADRRVALETDVTDRDRFGRLLRHVWVPVGDGWQLVGAALVASGAVEARSYPPDVARDDELDAAERRARSTRVGLWGNC
jgi:micrococcal nuclease